jgi:membrane protein implicated in regulation of membrane protease activity
MLFKLFRLQKNIRDLFQTVKDPNHVRTIISGLVLKTFTLALICIVVLTVAIGVVAVLFSHPALWVVFGLGVGISIGLFLVRVVVAAIIRRVVARVYREVQKFTAYS